MSKFSRIGDISCKKTETAALAQEDLYSDIHECVCNNKVDRLNSQLILCMYVCLSIGLALAAVSVFLQLMSPMRLNFDTE